MHWRTLENYVSDGAKYVLFASAGSVYLLALIAAAHLRGKIRKITHDVAIRLQHLIRCPDPNIAIGKVVIKDIIPAIAHLVKRNRLTYATMFNPALLASQGISPEIEVSDIIQSDTFFDSLIFNAIVKKRSVDVWKPLYSPLDSSINSYPYSAMQASLYNTTFSGPSSSVILPPSQHDLNFARDMQALEDPSFTSDPSKIHVIDTAFDPGLDENSKIKFKPNNKKERYRYTQRERSYVEKGVTCQSLNDFQEKARLSLALTEIQDQLSSGYKTNKKAYVKLSHDNLEGQRIRVNDKDGNPMFIVIPDMPDDIRDPLLNDLDMVQPGALRYTDSKEEGEKGKFTHAHFTWWNRYHISGEGAPSDVDPAGLRRAGKKRFNTAQCTPRTSCELQRNIEQYEQLRISLDRLFEWQRGVLKELLPDDYTIIHQYCDILPGDGSSPAYPFGGFVLNINVTTLIHRDYQDLKLCMVIVASDKDCEGGDLCLEEPGVCLELKNGDVIIFTSSKLSHFNTHFRGHRMSLVFHSDILAKAWLEYRNHWDHSFSMNVYHDGNHRTGQLEHLISAG